MENKDIVGKIREKLGEMRDSYPDSEWVTGGDYSRSVEFLDSLERNRDMMRRVLELMDGSLEMERNMESSVIDTRTDSLDGMAMSDGLRELLLKCPDNVKPSDIYVHITKSLRLAGNLSGQYYMNEFSEMSPDDIYSKLDTLIDEISYFSPEKNCEDRKCSMDFLCDALSDMNRSLDYLRGDFESVRPSGADIKSYFNDLSPVFSPIDYSQALRGYAVSDSDSLSWEIPLDSAYVLETIDGMRTFSDDAEAAAQAARDGIKLIPHNQLRVPDGTSLSHIWFEDSPHNRGLLKDYLVTPVYVRAESGIIDDFLMGLRQKLRDPELPMGGSRLMTDVNTVLVDDFFRMLNDADFSKHNDKDEFIRILIEKSGLYVEGEHDGEVEAVNSLASRMLNDAFVQEEILSFIKDGGLSRENVLKRIINDASFEMMPADSVQGSKDVYVEYTCNVPVNFVRTFRELGVDLFPTNEVPFYAHALFKYADEKSEILERSASDLTINYFVTRDDKEVLADVVFKNDALKEAFVNKISSEAARQYPDHFVSAGRSREAADNFSAMVTGYLSELNDGLMSDGSYIEMGNRLENDVATITLDRFFSMLSETERKEGLNREEITDILSQKMRESGLLVEDPDTGTEAPAVELADVLLHDTELAERVYNDVVLNGRFNIGKGDIGMTVSDFFKNDRIDFNFLDDDVWGAREFEGKTFTSYNARIPSELCSLMGLRTTGSGTHLEAVVFFENMTDGKVDISPTFVDIEEIVTDSGESIIDNSTCVWDKNGYRADAIKGSREFDEFVTLCAEKVGEQYLIKHNQSIDNIKFSFIEEEHQEHADVTVNKYTAALPDYWRDILRLPELDGEKRYQLMAQFEVTQVDSDGDFGLLEGQVSRVLDNFNIVVSLPYGGYEEVAVDDAYDHLFASLREAAVQSVIRDCIDVENRNVVNERMSDINLNFRADEVTAYHATFIAELDKDDGRVFGLNVDDGSSVYVETTLERIGVVPSEDGLLSGEICVSFDKLMDSIQLYTISSDGLKESVSLDSMGLDRSNEGFRNFVDNVLYSLRGQFIDKFNEKVRAVHESDIRLSYAGIHENGESGKRELFFTSRVPDSLMNALELPRKENVEYGLFSYFEGNPDGGINTNPTVIMLEERVVGVEGESDEFYLSNIDIEDSLLYSVVSDRINDSMKNDYVRSFLESIELYGVKFPHNDERTFEEIYEIVGDDIFMEYRDEAAYHHPDSDYAQKIEIMEAYLDNTVDIHHVSEHLNKYTLDNIMRDTAQCMVDGRFPPQLAQLAFDHFLRENEEYRELVYDGAVKDIFGIRSDIPFYNMRQVYDFVRKLENAKPLSDFEGLTADITDGDLRDVERPRRLMEFTKEVLKQVVDWHGTTRYDDGSFGTKEEYDGKVAEFNKTVDDLSEMMADDLIKGLYNAFHSMDELQSEADGFLRESEAYIKLVREGFIVDEMNLFSEEFMNSLTWEQIRETVGNVFVDYQNAKYRENNGHLEAKNPLEFDYKMKVNAVGNYLYDNGVPDGVDYEKMPEDYVLGQAMYSEQLAKQVLSGELSLSDALSKMREEELTWEQIREMVGNVFVDYQNAKYRENNGHLEVKNPLEFDYKMKVNAVGNYLYDNGVPDGVDYEKMPEDYVLGQAMYSQQLAKQILSGELSLSDALSKMREEELSLNNVIEIVGQDFYEDFRDEFGNLITENMKHLLLHRYLDENLDFADFFGNADIDLHRNEFVKDRLVSDIIERRVNIVDAQERAGELLRQDPLYRARVREGLIENVMGIPPTFESNYELMSSLVASGEDKFLETMKGAYDRNDINDTISELKHVDADSLFDYFSYALLNHNTDMFVRMAADGVPQNIDIKDFFTNLFELNADLIISQNYIDELEVFVDKGVDKHYIQQRLANWSSEHAVEQEMREYIDLLSSEYNENELESLVRNRPVMFNVAQMGRNGAIDFYEDRGGIVNKDNYNGIIGAVSSLDSDTLKEYLETAIECHNNDFADSVCDVIVAREGGKEILTDMLEVAQKNANIDAVHNLVLKGAELPDGILQYLASDILLTGNIIEHVVEREKENPERLKELLFNVNDEGTLPLNVAVDRWRESKGIDDEFVPSGLVSLSSAMEDVTDNKCVLKFHDGETGNTAYVLKEGLDFLVDLRDGDGKLLDSLVNPEGGCLISCGITAMSLFSVDGKWGQSDNFSLSTMELADYNRHFTELRLIKSLDSSDYSSLNEMSRFANEALANGRLPIAMKQDIAERQGWRHVDAGDGSGHFESPDGKSYFEYDTNTSEYKYMDEDKWRVDPDWSPLYAWNSLFDRFVKPEFGFDFSKDTQSLLAYAGFKERLDGYGDKNISVDRDSFADLHKQAESSKVFDCPSDFFPGNNSDLVNLIYKNENYGEAEFEMLANFKVNLLRDYYDAKVHEFVKKMDFRNSIDRGSYNDNFIVDMVSRDPDHNIRREENLFVTFNIDDRSSFGQFLKGHLDWQEGDELRVTCSDLLSNFKAATVQHVRDGYLMEDGKDILKAVIPNTSCTRDFYAVCDYFAEELCRGRNGMSVREAYFLDPKPAYVLDTADDILGALVANRKNDGEPYFTKEQAEVVKKYLEEGDYRLYKDKDGNLCTYDCSEDFNGEGEVCSNRDIVVLTKDLINSAADYGYEHYSEKDMSLMDMDYYSLSNDRLESVKAELPKCKTADEAARLYLAVMELDKNPNFIREADAVGGANLELVYYSKSSESSFEKSVVDFSNSDINVRTYKVPFEEYDMALKGNPVTADKLYHKLDVESAYVNKIREMVGSESKNDMKKIINAVHDAYMSFSGKDKKMLSDYLRSLNSKSKEDMAKSLRQTAFGDEKKKTRGRDDNFGRDI